jgi:S1-C subfamily serine protease
MKQQKIEVGDTVAYVWMRRIEFGTVDGIVKKDGYILVNGHLIDSRGSVYQAEEMVDGRIIIEV